MGYQSVLENMMEEKLMSIHTAFIGKIISLSADKSKATIQPLNKVKQYAKTAQKQSILQDVPILYNARYKLKPKKLKYVSNVSDHSPVFETLETVERIELKSGDVVFCVCADREISETKNGNFALPSVARHHNQSDCVIVGVL